MRLDALTALVTDLAGRFDDGAPDPGPPRARSPRRARSRWTPSREAVHLHGAFGMTDASPVRRHYLAAPIAVAADAPPAALRTEAASHD